MDVGSLHRCTNPIPIYSNHHNHRLYSALGGSPPFPGTLLIVQGCVKIASHELRHQLNAPVLHKAIKTFTTAQQAALIHSANGAVAGLLLQQGSLAATCRFGESGPSRISDYPFGVCLDPCNYVGVSAEWHLCAHPDASAQELQDVGVMLRAQDGHLMQRCVALLII